MPQPYDVRLKSNGRYWQAFWFDEKGNPRARSIGPKAEYSETKARAQCRTLAVDLKLGRQRDGSAPRLSAWLDQYKRQRTDVDPKTMALIDHTGRYLLAHFTNDPPISRIDRADAADWRAALARGELRAKANVYPKRDVAKTTRYQAYRKRLEARGAELKPLSEATVAKHVRTAKKIFEEATEEGGVGYIEKNPFRRLTGRAPRAAKDWAVVTRGDLDKILEACPDAGWRCLFALCRLAGLRRQEALDLRWADVLWDKNKLQVNATIDRETTKRAKRVCPIDPAKCPTGLAKILRDAFAIAPAGAVRPCESVSTDNIDKAAKRIIANAGLLPYKKPFHALRKNRAGEVAAVYPQHVHEEWMGHDAEVAKEYYLRVEEDLYAPAPEAQTTAQTDPSKAPANP
jgi:integrase